ncbi:MAG: glutathione S-transferase family protein [Pseudomonadales bacterium]
MPKIKPQNKTVLELRGLHLYHAGWSNCSMRVRMTLEEKALPWTSHHLNIRSGEHITPDYFGINPNGLVPTLVHDGDVWIESDDIISYLDDAFPEPRLTPASDTQLVKLSEWMSLASAIHVIAVKTYIYSSGSNINRRKTAAELERYRKLQTNEELLAFHTRSSSEGGFTDKDRRNAEQLLHDAFSQLDTYLGEHRWLVGDDFTLADITWVPLHYTLERVGFSFDLHTNVKFWARAIAERPSFQKAVVGWFDGPPKTDV